MKVAAFALMALGLLVALVGLNAMSQSSSDMSRFVEGEVANRTGWILLFGILVFCAGVGSLFPAFRKPPD
jgi:hypothetical protein